MKYDKAEVVTDAYSTTYPCTYENVDTKLEKPPVKINEMVYSKANLENGDSQICCVYDAWVKTGAVTSRLDLDNSSFIFCGTANYVVMCKTEEGTPLYLETDMPFETKVMFEDLNDDSYAEVKAEVCSCTYNLTSTNSVEVKADINISGYLYESNNYTMMSNINVNESASKDRDGEYALKLYFAQAGEDIWEIAKKYSTSIKAIMDENDLVDDKLSENGMLLIPIMN